MLLQRFDAKILQKKQERSNLTQKRGITLKKHLHRNTNHLTDVPLQCR